jgi:hypothetical protein
MVMTVGDTDGWAKCSCSSSLTSKGMWFVSCLLDLDRAVVPHHTHARPHPLVRPLRRPYSIGWVKPLGFKFSSSHAASACAAPPPPLR